MFLLRGVVCNDLPKHPCENPDDLGEFELNYEMNYEVKYIMSDFMHYLCKFDAGFKVIVT